MDEKLLNYFNEIRQLSSEEINGIAETNSIHKFKKGTLLLKEGQISTDTYFVLQGCVRQYFMVAGEEKTNNFFTESQWVVSLSSFNPNLVSKFYLECCEDCSLVVGNSAKADELFKKFPKLETVSRKVMEKVFAEQQEIMGSYFTDTPEQRYLKLQETRPELLQRIPQYHIASYIGVKPESLSRIRKRLANKKNE